MSKVITVGVDGSMDSTAALNWAVDHAAVSDAVVRAAHVSVPPRHGLLRRRDRALEAGEGRDVAEAETILSGAPRRPDGESVVVEHRVFEGMPGPVLVELSRDADLLVVGATGRDRHTFDHTPSPGSTARYVMRNAACPVAVIRESHVRDRTLVDVRASGVALRSTSSARSTHGVAGRAGTAAVPPPRTTHVPEIRVRFRDRLRPASAREGTFIERVRPDGAGARRVEPAHPGTRAMVGIRPNTLARPGSTREQPETD